MKFQHTKNSLKNVYRSGGKSALFMVLILLLTVLSSLSLSVFVSIQQYLGECDDFYTTIGVLEYMAPDYPDEEVYNPDMQEAIRSFDDTLITDYKEVLSFQRSNRSLGYIDGFERFDAEAAHEDMIVAKARVMFEVFEDGSVIVDTAKVTEELYSNSDTVNKPLIIYELESWLSNYDTGVHEISLIFHGKALLKGRRGYLTYGIMPKDEELIITGTHSEGLLIEDISGREDDYTLDSDNIYGKLARTYLITRNAVTVYASSDLALLAPFNQQQANLVEGRLFSEGEYATGDKVCIVTEVIADKLGVSIGDYIPLSLSVLAGSTPSQSYWADEGFDQTGQYEVVGIIRVPRETNYAMYIPVDEQVNYLENQLGYVVGTIEISNSGADTFYNDIIEKLPERFHLTIYDQGYAQAAKPLFNINRIALIMSVSSILATLVIILLYGYLFVYRQREVSDIMMKLGTGTRAIYQYYLTGSLFIATLAVTIGVFLSTRLVTFVEQMMYDALNNYVSTDLRFSNGNLSIINALEFSPEIGLSFFVIVGACIVLLTLISCYIFTKNTFKHKTRGIGINLVRKVKHSSTMKGGFTKYAWLSISRGWLRTAVVGVVVVGMLLFLGQLANTTESYHDNIDSLKHDTVINARFTDIKGRMSNRLGLEAFHMLDLILEGYVTDFHASRSIPTILLGISEADGITYDVPPITPPTGGFAKERFYDDIMMGSRIVFTNSIQDSPEFYYSNQVQITYLDGYDDSIFSQREQDEDARVCVLPISYMEENGIQLGDTVRFYTHWFDFVDFYLNRDLIEAGVDYKVIGHFEKETVLDHFYSPLCNYIEPVAFEDDSEENRQRMFYFALDSAGFSLSDTAKLDEFRDFLDSYGFSEVTKLRTFRTFIVLDDKSYVSTLDMMYQQLDYIGILYPILYVVVGIVGGLVAFLIILSRRRELSTMRGLGASKTTTMLTFFTEQVALNLIGTAVALGISLVIFGHINLLQWQLTGAFSVMYLAGTWISLYRMNHKKTLKLLKVED